MVKPLHSRRPRLGVAALCSLLMASVLSLAAVPALAQEAESLQRQDGSTVPVSVFLPKTSPCRGVAIISPGAGGSEKGYAYLGEGLSGVGYLAVVVGHQESGRRALREHMRGAGLREGLADLITDPAAYRGRFMDIAAARQWATARCPAAELLLVGHSMGAATTIMEAGARNKLGVTGADAFSAYIALSPQGVGSIFPAGAWSDIKRPVLSITGTRDDELGGGSWRTRTEPYANMPPGCKWLAVIEGATHMNLAGNGMSRPTQALSLQVIGAFLDAVRQGDCRGPAPQRGIDVQAK